MARIVDFWKDVTESSESDNRQSSFPYKSRGSDDEYVSDPDLLAYRDLLVSTQADLEDSGSYYSVDTGGSSRWSSFLQLRKRDFND